MAKSPKSSGSPSHSKKNSKVSSGALVASIILALIVIGLGIAIIVLSCQSPNGSFTWGHGSQCKSNTECIDKLCKGALGCCAICDKGGKCKQGMLTANGCTLSEDPSNNENTMEALSKKIKEKVHFSKDNMEPKFSASNYYDQANVPEGGFCGNQVTAAQNYPGGLPVSDSYATSLLCGPGKYFPGCCAVTQNGQAVQGVMSNGVCQTQIQQDAWSGWGKAMPNTYLISTSGPKVGVSMGNCNVRPIQSSLQNYTGFFDSCKVKAPVPDYGREYESSYAPSNFSSCG